LTIFLPLLLSYQKGRSDVSQLSYTVELYILNTVPPSYSQKPQFSGSYADTSRQGNIRHSFLYHFDSMLALGTANK